MSFQLQLKYRFTISVPKLWMKPKTIQNKEQNMTHNIGICVQKLFNLQDNMIPNIVAYLEMQRILGISQVCIQNTVGLRIQISPRGLVPN